MAFTTKDREELSRARRIVEELEAKEREALQGLADVLLRAGLLVDDYHDWSDVAQAADAIRDALAPFDSGVRVAPDGL